MKTKWMLTALGLLSNLAWAGTNTFSFSGTLLDPTNGNQPLVSSSVSLLLEIYDPGGTCLLYREQQAVNTSTTNGDFAIQVGAGARQSGDPGLTWPQIFQSSGQVQGCFTASAGNGRSLRITVNGTTLSPDFPISSVPMATSAETLAAGSTISGDLTLSNSSTPPALLLLTGTGTTGFRPPGGLSGSSIYTLPSSYPGGGGFMLTGDGAGNLSWTPPMVATSGSVLDPVTTTPGGMLYRGSSSWQAIPVGTAGNVLTFNGTSPSWQPPSLPSLPNGQIWMGNASNVPAAVTMSGDATISSAGVLTLKTTSTAGTYTKVTTDSQGRVLSGSTLSDSDLDSVAVLKDGSNTSSVTIGGTSVALATSGMTVMTMTSGNVGIGTTFPSVPLDVRSSNGSGPTATFTNTSSGGSAAKFSSMMTNTTQPTVSVLNNAANTVSLTLTNQDSASNFNGPTLLVGQNGYPIRTISYFTIPGTSASCSTLSTNSAFSCTFSASPVAVPSGMQAFFQCYATTPQLSGTGFNTNTSGAFIIMGVSAGSGGVTAATFNCMATMF
jgi:hypothetical protein